MDIGAPTGTEVVCPGVGKVVATHKPGDGWGDGSFGICVVLDHVGTPWYSIYAHLLSVDPAVSIGMTLLPGTRIGYVGMTGTTTGPHLHWQLSKNENFPKDANLSDDPLAYLNPAVGGVDPNVRLANLEAKVLRLEKLIGGNGILGPTSTTDKPDLFGEQALQHADQRGFSALLSGQLAYKRFTELTILVTQIAAGGGDPSLKQELIDGLGALLARLEKK